VLVRHANLLPYKLQTFRDTINSLNQESILIILWRVPKPTYKPQQKNFKMKGVKLHLMQHF
jgi:hypothetical protein